MLNATTARMADIAILAADDKLCETKSVVIIFLESAGNDFINYLVLSGKGLIISENYPFWKNK